MISAFINNIHTLKMEWPEASKSRHAKVDYENPSKDQSKVCQGCVNFIPPNRCRTVASPIDLTGWCVRYQKQ